MVTDANPHPTLRKDAWLNRQRILDAAKEVFAEQGLDAPLVEITRRAGVGDGTFYRRFPTRADLHAALQTEAQDVILRLGEQALLIEDGWTALSSYLERSCEFVAANRAIGELMVLPNSDPAARKARDRQGETALRELIDRAQRQGSLHPDVTLGDLSTIITALLVLIPASAGVAPQAWRRQLAFALNGLRPHDSLALPAIPPITSQQHDEIVNRLFLRHGQK
jgi:AcrR family transcriptional regulator